MVDFEDFDDFEDWEADYNLMEKRDYQKLVKFREIYFKNNPDDILDPKIKVQ